MADDSDQDLHEVRQREKELRRAKGEISCSECRRLKLRCDRKVPCSSCVRRHCENLCPNGRSNEVRTSSSRSTKTVEELQAKLDEMTERVRQLEEALRRANASNPESTAGRQGDGLSAISGLSGHDETAMRPDFPSELIDTLGTLTLTDGGESRFLGPSAAPETFLVNEFSCHDEDDVPHHLSPALAMASRRCPFAPAFLSQDEYRTLIESHMPSYERATALCEAFLENLAWFMTSINREQITQELLPVIYRRKQKVMPDGTEMRLDAHDLALLLSVFACGAAGDLTQVPNNEEGLLYFHLARAALGLRSVLSNASLVTVQTMVLLGLYDFFSCRRSTAEESWKMLSFATGIATSVGLHRDPGRWKLDPKMQERRRAIFWELYLLDSWQTLACGRTPTLTPRSIDVKPFPLSPPDEDTKSIIAANHKYWKYEFLRRCLAPVTDRYCGVAAPVKFYEALEFDRMINKYRAERVSSVKQMERFEPSGMVMDMVDRAKRLQIQVYCDMLLLCVHRNFFARAIIDYPQNPLASPFATSFLATFQSAQDVLKILAENVDSLLPLLLRIWPYWSHMLAAAVVSGSIAHRCPAFGLAPSAYTVLESAITSFEKATIHPVVRNGLPVLYRLREKAQKAMFDAHNPSAPSRAPSSEPGVKIEVNEDEELDILRGATRLIAQKRNHSNSKNCSVQSSPRSRDASSVSPPAAQGVLPMSTFPSQQPYGVTSSSNNGPVYNATSSPETFDWTSLMEAAGMNQEPQGVTATSMAAAVEDGAFANLEPEAFLGSANTENLPGQLYPQEYGNMAVDDWNPYAEASSAQFFGNWKF